MGNIHQLNIRMIQVFKKWLDNENSAKQELGSEEIDWLRIIPFIFIHLACFGVIWVGTSSLAVVVCFISYFVRMFAITAFYHRYFSHKTFKTSRAMQTVFAVIGATATQRGPLWWAAHHRHHHVHSDTDEDTHSPQQGFWHSHMAWFLQKKNFATQTQRVKDLNQFKELRWIDRYDIVFPFLYACGLFALGSYLEKTAPQLNTSGGQLLVWGYFISTVLLAHVTFCINSLAHVLGTRSYNTNDDSRNNFILAILTLGEGWHNNHHCAPGSVKQGFKWWQIDISYYLIVLMKKLGLVWDLKQPSQRLLRQKSLVKP